MLDKTPEDLNSVADEAFRLHSDDPEQMHQFILRAARKSPAVMNEIVYHGIDEAVRGQFSKNRRRVIDREPAEREPMPEVERRRRIEAMQERRDFWDRYSLFGQQLLATASANDLRESAAKRKTMAHTNLRRAEFELALAKEMGTSTKTVSRFFKPERVEELAEKYNA